MAYAIKNQLLSGFGKHCGVLLMLLPFSCGENKTVKKLEWDYLNSSFNNTDHQSRLGMLCGNDMLELKKINDSVFIMNLHEFQGWKKKSKQYSDTLKLTINKKVLDSLGNQKKQVLGFSNQNNVGLEVIISKTGTVPGSGISTYEYQGKIKIHNDKLTYSCDRLWVK